MTEMKRKRFKETLQAAALGILFAAPILLIIIFVNPKR